MKDINSMNTHDSQRESGLRTHDAQRESGKWNAGVLFPGLCTHSSQREPGLCTHSSQREPGKWNAGVLFPGLCTHKLSHWNRTFQLLRRRSLTIDIDGRLSPTLSLVKYKTHILELMALIMIGFMAYIIKRFPYYPITVVGNTVYSRVAAASLSRYKIPYILCRGNNRIPYYSTEDGNEIAFEGPSTQYFLVENNRVVPLIPHSELELTRIQDHTKLNNLSTIQAQVLKGFLTKDGVHVASMKDLIHDGTEARDPAIAIHRFCGNMYYVMTTTEVWLTRMVITDIVSPLQPGDIISGINGIVTDEPNINYQIEHKDGFCIIREPLATTVLKRGSNYKVSPDLRICSIDSLHTHESVLYNLETPRSFIHHSLNVIHPFHLPQVWDPFLAIMIITLASVASVASVTKSS